MARLVLALLAASLLATPALAFVGAIEEFTTSGTGSQALFGGARPAHGFEVVNPDPSEQCNLSEGAAATASTGVVLWANGGGYVTPQGYDPVGTVNVICPTSGHKLTTRRW